MALTKVRSPVTAIQEMAFTTTTVEILSAGGDIDINVAGVDALDIRSTEVVVDAALTLVSTTQTAETINFSTAAGADATIETTLSQLEIGTTTAHPTVLSANGNLGIRVETGGQVHLGSVGAAGNHLIDKDYVDNAVALLPALTDIIFASTSTGSLQIPTDGDTFIINWGITASLNNSFETVTFDTAFPNAVLCALSTGVIDASKEASSQVHLVTTTNMRVVQSGSGGSRPVYWIAIGF